MFIKRYKSLLDFKKVLDKKHTSVFKLYIYIQQHIYLLCARKIRSLSFKFVLQPYLLTYKTFL